MLLAPAAGLAPFHWYMRLFLTLWARLPVKPSARSILRMQAHKGFVPDEAFVALMETMTRTARTDVLFPVPLTDRELSSIQARCLVLIGEEEMLYDSRLALHRALSHMPNAEGELVSSASHLLIMERPDEVNRRLLAFLASGTGSRTS
jgi:pimeloyl-ACP methyl ester carboxylesterase